MSSKIRSYRGAAALAATLAALAALVPALGASAKPADPHRAPLVVRGQDTVTERSCAAGICQFELEGGTFRGTPVGTGAYEGTMNVHLAEAFENGEGGVCAPVDGNLTLGVGPPDRLVLAFAGDSCQDGAGDPTTTSFTGLTRFTVQYGTGAYEHARGHGVASFNEGADDRERMTLIGRIKH
jgi:hypothetical protein